MHTDYKEYNTVNSILNNSKKNNNEVFVHVVWNKESQTFYNDIKFSHIFRVNTNALFANEKDWSNTECNPNSDVMFDTNEIGNKAAFGILRNLKQVDEKYILSKKYAEIINREYVVELINKEELETIKSEIQNEVYRLNSILSYLNE